MISGSDLSLIARRFATCRPVPAIIFGDFIRYMIRDISTSGAVPDFLARFTAFISGWLQSKEPHEHTNISRAMSFF